MSEKQDMPSWEFALLVRKDPLAEGIKWLEEHGFYPLSVTTRKEFDADTWTRRFGEGDGQAVLFAVWRNGEWRSCLSWGKGSIEVADGRTPFEAFESLAQKVPLAEILDKTL